MSEPIPAHGVYNPDGVLLRVVLTEVIGTDQRISLLAEAWHRDKPDEDYTACTLPQDAHTASAKGYRLKPVNIVPR